MNNKATHSLINCKSNYKVWHLKPKHSLYFKMEVVRLEQWYRTEWNKMLGLIKFVHLCFTCQKKHRNTISTAVRRFRIHGPVNDDENIFALVNLPLQWIQMKHHGSWVVFFGWHTYDDQAPVCTVPPHEIFLKKGSAYNKTLQHISLTRWYVHVPLPTSLKGKMHTK